MYRVMANFTWGPVLTLGSEKNGPLFLTKGSEGLPLRNRKKQRTIEHTGNSAT